MIRVRLAQSKDVESVLEIASHSVTSAHWSASDYSKLCSSRAIPEQVALVIEENRRVRGFLAARQVASDEWEIENVAISGSSRRRGLGSRLLGEFLNVVRELGGKNVFLEVRESNHAARTLYEKWAFVETGRRRNYYQEPAEDALTLRFSFPEKPASGSKSSDVVKLKSS